MITLHCFAIGSYYFVCNFSWLTLDYFVTETRTFLLIVSLCLFQLIFPSYAVAQDILYREVRSSSEDHKFKLLDMTQHFFIRKVKISSENWNNEIYFHIDFEIDLTKTFLSGSELTVTIRDWSYSIDYRVERSTGPRKINFQLSVVYRYHLEQISENLS